MMIIVSILPVIFVFGIICLQLSNRINNVNFAIDSLEKKINYTKQEVELNQEIIKLQNKSIRDVHDVVKKIAKENEPAEPDTKALISGWDADEPEPVQQLISKEELMQQLVKANLNCQSIEPLPQQCILPLPFQQTPSGAKMGIYIKGLKAPESCERCRMSRWSNIAQHYVCDICNEIVATFVSEYESAKPDWCPLVEVPEPHGDLIDRDALGVGEYEREDYDSGTLEISLGGLLDIYHKVKDAPAIIAREDGETDEN